MSAVLATLLWRGEEAGEEVGPSLEKAHLPQHTATKDRVWRRRVFQLAYEEEEEGQDYFSPARPHPRTMAQSPSQRLNL